MYHQYAFGDAKLAFPEIDSARTAAEAMTTCIYGGEIAPLGDLYREHSRT